MNQKSDLEPCLAISLEIETQSGREFRSKTANLWYEPYNIILNIPEYTCHSVYLCFKPHPLVSRLLFINLVPHSSSTRSFKYLSTIISTPLYTYLFSCNNYHLLLAITNERSLYSVDLFFKKQYSNIISSPQPTFLQSVLILFVIQQCWEYYSLFSVVVLKVLSADWCRVIAALLY